MPYRLSEDGNTVVNADTGKPVPGGEHKTHSEYLAHLRALDIHVEDAHTQKADTDPHASSGQAPLPTLWVRAHPYGDPATRDAHKEYFDDATNFHDELLSSIPVSYYHNRTDDGAPNGEPLAIGRTDARRYASDGRWDHIQWFDDIPPVIRAELTKADANGTLRASPTVVPDFHEVGPDGHIKDWLTASIAVFGMTNGKRPASPNAISAHDMKALYKAAHIKYPENLTKAEDPTMAEQKANWMTKARAAFDTFMKAVTDPDDEGRDDDPDSELEKALHTESATQRGMYDETFDDDAPTDDTRFGHGAQGNLMKEKGTEMGQDKPEPNGKPKGDDKPADGDVALEFQRKENATMKAQFDALQARFDASQNETWFDEQLRAGKVVPAQKADVLAALAQFTADDRAQHPTMKSADGATVSRVAAYQKSITDRAALVDLNTMKAAGYRSQTGDREETELTDAKRQELLAKSALGSKILQEEKRNGNGHN